MISSINNKYHITRIIIALVVAQLIHIPIWFISALGYSLFEAFTSTEYIGQARLFSSELFLVVYAVAVSFVVTLVYGIPIYLVLKRFKKASSLNLAIAGALPFVIISLISGPFDYPAFLYALYGATIATTFWMVVTAHSPRTSRIFKSVAISLAALTVVLIATTLMIDIFFKDNLRTARLERALSNKAPIPEWWEQVDNDRIFDNIEEARDLYDQYDRHGAKNELRQRQNREFFKSAYLTIRDVKQDPNFIVELVLLMNMPHIEYPHMAQLQWYTLALRLPEDEPRARILTALLNTAPVNSKDYSRATSWSYDLLTGNKVSAQASTLLLNVS